MDAKGDQKGWLTCGGFILKLAQLTDHVRRAITERELAATAMLCNEARDPLV